LFAKAPWFMTSQVKNTSFHPDYEPQFIEETAFQIPDKYMMTNRYMGNDYDRYNWCMISDETM